MATERGERKGRSGDLRSGVVARSGDRPQRERRQLWECSGLTELWDYRGAAFFGSGDGERTASESSKAGSSPRTPKDAGCAATSFAFDSILILAITITSQMSPLRGFGFVRGCPVLQICRSSGAIPVNRGGDDFHLKSRILTSEVFHAHRENKTRFGIARNSSVGATYL